jgi:hypothetical protein
MSSADTHRRTHIHAHARTHRCARLPLSFGALRTQGSIDRADLATAKYKLLELNVAVGIFERYTESLRLWGVAGRFNLSTFLSCSDAGPATPRPTDAQLESLNRMHSLDSELYAFARKLFRRQWFRLHGGRVLPPYVPSRPQCGNERGCLLTSAPEHLVPNTTLPKRGEVVCWRRCNMTRVDTDQQ